MINIRFVITMLAEFKDAKRHTGRRVQCMYSKKISVPFALPVGSEVWVAQEAKFEAMRVKSYEWQEGDAEVRLILETCEDLEIEKEDAVLACRAYLKTVEELERSGWENDLDDGFKRCFSEIIKDSLPLSE